jgi:uncharacterized protein (DUF1499 family)
MKIVLVMVLLILMVVIVVAATLIKNQAHFFEAPGFAERLSIYLGQHTAATSDNHSFPELRTPVFYVDADSLFSVVIEVVNDLGWQLRQIDDENLTLSLVITTPLFRFSDDLVVQVKPKNAQLNSEESTLAIHSTSRKGKADFAANAGHIQTLVQQVRQKVNQGR